MKRRLTGIILLLGLLTVLTFNVAHADWNGGLNVAEAARDNTKDHADTGYDEMQNANALYSKAKSEYDANRAAINRGVLVTSAKLLAASVTVYMSGGVTATVAVSTLVDMLNLSEAIKSSTSLESAYESAIGAKSSYLRGFEADVSTYNSKYDAYISTLATHTGWTSQQVVNMIGDGSNPVVSHKGSVTPTEPHGGRTRKNWAPYDKSLPSFMCVGPCDVTFTMPSAARTDHEETCGTAKNVEAEATRTVPYNPGQYRAEIKRILRSRSVSEGCGRSYFDCSDAQKADHIIRTCKNRGRRWNSDTNSYDQVTCNMSYRNCLNTGGKCFNGQVSGNPIHRDDVNSQNSLPIVISTDPNGTIPTPAPPAVTYEACGVHRTGSSGNHSLQASCSSTNSSGQSCTVTSFYACNGHSHLYPAPPPPTTVSCARKACGGQVSYRLQHRVNNCTNCNGVYWTCYPGAIGDHVTSFTCRRPGCGATFTRCSNGSCTSDWGTHPYHWAQ